MLASPQAAAAGEALEGVAALLGFSQDEDETGCGRVADALEYLKLRGKDAGDLRYLEPGGGPFGLDGVDGVRVYVLGPPRDPILLKSSEVTERMKKEGVIYHLSSTGEAGMDALSAAVTGAPGTAEDRYHPFSAEHRITRTVADLSNPGVSRPNPYFSALQSFVAETYDDPQQAWRRIDNDWLSAFGQLALDLDNDTNNTCLVLAIEFAEDARRPALRRRRAGRQLAVLGEARVQGPGPRTAAARRTIFSAGPSSTRSAIIAATTRP